MFTELVFTYYHPVLNIGVQDIRNVWLLNDVPVKLALALHRGSLVFRLPGSGKRVSYHTLKRGLIKKTFIISLPLQLLPF